MVFSPFHLLKWAFRAGVPTPGTSSTHSRRVSSRSPCPSSAYNHHSPQPEVASAAPPARSTGKNSLSGQKASLCYIAPNMWKTLALAISLLWRKLCPNTFTQWGRRDGASLTKTTTTSPVHLAGSEDVSLAPRAGVQSLPSSSNFPAGAAIIRQLTKAACKFIPK